jgi:hypothetical protein
MTMMLLNTNEVPYRVVDVFNEAGDVCNKEAHGHLKSLGLEQLPVIEVGTKRFWGFRPDRLRGLIAAWRDTN